MLSATVQFDNPLNRQVRFRIQDYSQDSVQSWHVVTARGQGLCSVTCTPVTEGMGYALQKAKNATPSVGKMALNAQG